MDAKIRIAEATRAGLRLGKDAYGYSRAFKHTPDEQEMEWLQKEHRRLDDTWPVTILDPTAGGGSIPFESVRLHTRVVANDLNPVAWLILKATVEFPAHFGPRLRTRFQELGKSFVKRMQYELHDYFPSEPLPNSVPDGYLWARTVHCPYCGGLVPLSPNWRLNSFGTGVRLVPQSNADRRCCTFEMVDQAKDHSPGTVKGGDGLCPFPDCGRVIDGDEIKSQAQAGKDGPATLRDRLQADSKGRRHEGNEPQGQIQIRPRIPCAPGHKTMCQPRWMLRLAAKMPEWQARGIVPDERIDDLSITYSMTNVVTDTNGEFVDPLIRHNTSGLPFRHLGGERSIHLG